MTDIRCPHCDHAFFAHVEPRPNDFSSANPDKYQYVCRNCHTSLVIPVTADADLSQWQAETVITCLHCDAETLNYIWSGDSMDGDAEDAYQCPTCEDMVYSVRTCSEATATGAEYTTANPFAAPDETADTGSGDHSQTQTDLTEWDGADGR